jgi:hypothetical protein
VGATVRRYIDGPLVAGATIFVAAILFGWWRRNFGVFLLGLFGFPVLALIALACFVVAAAKGDSRRGMAIGAVLIVAAPFAESAAINLRDPIRFALWEGAHRHELEQLRARDRIVTGWDSWGLAGSDSFSYLIVDTRDDSTTAAGADRWQKRMRLECPIVDSRRMAERIYIVTTYECPFDGVPLPS